MRPELLVLLEGQLDPSKAAALAALAEERDRKSPAELAPLLGNPLVSAAEDLLRLHRWLPSLFGPRSQPWGY
jgi:hypothetical protein